MVELLCTSILWGLSFSIAKLSLQKFSPYELVFIRLTLATITSYSIAKLSQQNRFGTMISPISISLGVFEFAGTYLLYTLALSYLPSGLVGMLTLMTPIFTLLIGRVINLYSLTQRNVIAIFLALFGGVFCLPAARDQVFSLSTKSGIGIALITLSNVSFSLGNILISKWSAKKPWDQGYTVYGLAWGAVFSLVICIFVKHEAYGNFLNPLAWVSPLYLGVVATGVGFYLWNRGVQKTSAFKASIIGNFKAPLSVLWGALLLGEKFSGLFFIGAAMLFFAAIMANPVKK